jgi:hypothetical protein
MSGYCEGTGLYNPTGCCTVNNNTGSTSFLWSNYETTTFTDSNVNIGYSNNPYKLAVNGSIYASENILSTGAAHNSLTNTNAIIHNLMCTNGDFNRITAHGYCNLIRNHLTTESNFVPSCALLSSLDNNQQPLWSNYNENIFTMSNVGIGFSNRSEQLAIDGDVYVKNNILSTGAANVNLINANAIFQNVDVVNLLAKIARIDNLLVNKLTMINLLDKQLFGSIKKSSETQTIAATITWENINNIDNKNLNVKISQNLSTNSSTGSITKSVDINTFVPVSWEQSHNSGAGLFDIYKTLSLNVTQTNNSITFESMTTIDTNIKSHTISIDILSIPIGLGNILIT